MSQLMPDAGRGTAKRLRGGDSHACPTLGITQPAETLLLSCHRLHGHLPHPTGMSGARGGGQGSLVSVSHNQPSTRGPSTRYMYLYMRGVKPPYVRKWTHGGSQSWAIFTYMINRYPWLWITMARRRWIQTGIWKLSDVPPTYMQSFDSKVPLVTSHWLFPPGTGWSFMHAASSLRLVSSRK